MAQKQIEVQRKIEEGNKETSVWLKADLEKQLTKARKKRMADEMCEKELVAKMERLEKHQSMWKSIIPAKGAAAEENIYEDMKGISKASTSASSSSHSVYNPLQTYINTFDPVSEEENIKIAVANLEEMVGEEDKKEINDEDMPDDAANISIQMGQFQHHVTPEVYPPNSTVKIVKFMWLVSSLLMSVIILMLGIMSSRLENRENNCPDLKNFNFITPRNRNNTFMNNTGNVCYSSLSLIGKEYKPIAVNLPNRDHCETIYYLGNRDYVYACRHDGDFSIVFTTADINGIDFVDIGLSWRQFCSLMFMSDRLIDDLTHIMFSV